MKNTSFHISGFWFHVDWDSEGKTGIDQQGRKWTNIDNPEPELRLLPAICKAYGESVKLMSSLIKITTNE